MKLYKIAAGSIMLKQFSVTALTLIMIKKTIIKHTIYNNKLLVSVKLDAIVKLDWIVVSSLFVTPKTHNYTSQL